MRIRLALEAACASAPAGRRGAAARLSRVSRRAERLGAPHAAPHALVLEHFAERQPEHQVLRLVARAVLSALCSTRAEQRTCTRGSATQKAHCVACGRRRKKRGGKLSLLNSRPLRALH